MLKYKNEVIKNENGIDCFVLDLEKLDFSKAVLGVKSSITKVKRANGGERIIAANKKGEIESVTIANKNDAIFINSETDQYIPHLNGERYQFNEIGKYGYDIVKKEGEFVFVRSNNKALLLVEIIKQPTCIKDAWGKGKHQFLFEGATLKKDLKTNKVTGIFKEAFYNTWLILETIKEI